jgi:hypothetical protein
MCVHLVARGGGGARACLRRARARLRARGSENSPPRGGARVRPARRPRGVGRAPARGAQRGRDARRAESERGVPVRLPGGAGERRVRHRRVRGGGLPGHRRAGRRSHASAERVRGAVHRVLRVVLPAGGEEAREQSQGVQGREHPAGTCREHIACPNARSPVGSSFYPFLLTFLSEKSFFKMRRKKSARLATPSSWPRRRS